MTALLIIAGLSAAWLAVGGITMAAWVLTASMATDPEFADYTRTQVAIGALLTAVTGALVAPVGLVARLLFGRRP
jgi:hypothetical protein